MVIEKKTIRFNEMSTIGKFSNFPVHKKKESKENTYTYFYIRNHIKTSYKLKKKETLKKNKGFLIGIPWIFLKECENYIMANVGHFSNQ